MVACVVAAICRAEPASNSWRARFNGLDDLSELGHLLVDAEAESHARRDENIKERGERWYAWCSKCLAKGSDKGFRAILERFLAILIGSILGLLKGRFRSFFDAFALEQANSLQEEATAEKPIKTCGFS